MMLATHNPFRAIAQRPSRFLIVHYSSQSLFDEGTEGLSPRITSIAVMDYSTRQTVSFAVHSTAELLGIKKENVETRYDDIEKQMLAEFFSFAAGKLDRVWIHWNMRNLTFGFERLEHRSRRLGNQSPPTISVEQRLNLNDMLKENMEKTMSPIPR